MKRLHLVVEGHGDVEAAPQLAVKVLLDLGRLAVWGVSKSASRLPRSGLVDESSPSPRRAPLPLGLERAAALARSNRADALLILVDADDDCPAAFGPAASSALELQIPAGAVMAVREYEAWLLSAYSEDDLKRVKAENPESKRNAKGALARLVEGYLPATHQLPLTKAISVPLVRTRCPSFDKFYREIARLTGN